MTTTNTTPSILLAMGCAAWLACGGGSSPSEPRPPGQTPPAAVAGQFTGTILYLRGEPADHCFARWIQLETGGTGHSFRAQVTLEQSGESISGEVLGLDIVTRCQVSGSVSGNSVSWSQTECADPCEPFDHPTNPCGPFELCLEAQTFSGAGSSTRLQGDAQLVYRARAQADGQDLGTVTVPARLDVTR